MNTNIEKRHLRGLEIRAAAKDSGSLGILVGYAAVFNSDSEEMRSASRPRPFVETIEKGAFKRSLETETESRDIYALWNHDDAMPFARMGKNMRLAEDERGLKVEIDVPDTSVGRDVLENIKRGIVDAMSFSFRCREKDGQEWRKGEQRDSRVLKDVILFEVSPVVWPAYPDTSLAIATYDEFARACEKDPELRAWNPFKQLASPQKGDEKPLLRALWDRRIALLERK